jgi:hypothetical protein
VDIVDDGEIVHELREFLIEGHPVQAAHAGRRGNPGFWRRSPY